MSLRHIATTDVYFYLIFVVYYVFHDIKTLLVLMERT